ncbi:hypothetical protein [Rhodoferax sediminis]|uniref:Uncharacterized protein n=1 Tax=Rhodoferax sediminis TaxID=2509614 RepID=A0A515DE76_9BURK|nr:hypothetical protein [Rhodoferax sediminis]QDL38713.1 hypothetical protein EUB48_16505 [Rhodoferax sediminis]
MSTLKDALCLLAIFFAYGITGHMDYEDAVMLEETQRNLRPSASTDCWPTITSPTGHPAAQVRHLRSDPQRDDQSDPASGTPPEAIELCPPVVY